MVARGTRCNARARPHFHFRRACMSSVRTLSLTLALSLGCAAGAARAADAPGHFDAQGKPPSTFTLELRNGFKAPLPFSDKRDFDEAAKGFIAAPPYKKIMADAGHVAWDMDSYQWLLSGQDFASIHPSLQRQAVLNMAYGLLRGGAGAHLPGARLRPRQHQLHQGRHRLDHLRPADRGRNRPGRARTSSTRSSASGRWSASCTRTRTATTSAACAASWTRPTSRAAR